jgi:hypothetical protein
MKFWLLCLPEEDMEHCINIGTFGLSRKYVLAKVEPGDPIVFCASKIWKILGVGHATKGHYVNSKQVFLKDGQFDNRFDFESTRFPATHKRDLMSVIDQLSFVTNLAGLVPSLGRGRNRSYPRPPARIRASATNAHGSYLR